VDKESTLDREDTEDLRVYEEQLMPSDSCLSLFSESENRKQA